MSDFFLVSYEMSDYFFSYHFFRDFLISFPSLSSRQYRTCLQIQIVQNVTIYELMDATLLDCYTRCS